MNPASVKSANEALDSDNDSEDGESPKPQPDRAQNSKATDQAPRKENVQGKQGGLEGIMTMPIEVLNEIPFHLTPADLVSLTRVNKLFRSILLSRQALQFWQRAQNNVPELPPCPTGMSEPQYAALMFSKHCTLCGANATSKPDPRLRVRLCASCRHTKLGHVPGYSMEDMYVATSWDIEPRRPIVTASYIIEEYEEANKIRNELQKKSDRKGLEEWKNRRTAQLKAQQEEAAGLERFIRSAEMSRRQELRDFKATRQQQVEEKLRALGWEDQYLRFWDSPHSWEWNSLIRAPKELTERVWASLLPKLTPLLETNRKRIDEPVRLRRRRERREKALELARQLTHDMYPYHAIMKTLDLKPPGLHLRCPDSTSFLFNPSPSVDVMAGWDILAETYLEENSLERVEELFNQRRPEITERVLKWREEFETKLVEVYLGGDETEEVNFIVKIKGSTEPADNLSPNAKLLLRADTIFVDRFQSRYWASPKDKEYGPGLRGTHFPEVIFESHDSNSNPRTGGFVRHIGAEKIVKALLKDLCMPDASYMEVNMQGSAYSCQRCRNLPFACWEDPIRHYQVRLSDWIGGHFTNNRYTTRHPVIFLPTHNLQLGPDARPLARMLLNHEARASEPTNPSKERYLWCLICSGARLRLHSECSSLEVLKEHMHENHAITGELVEGLHYTNQQTAATRQHACVSQWQNKWDDFYDAEA